MGEALLPKLVRGDKFISVQEHEYRGRYVVCNKSLEAGKVILKEGAYATAVFDSMKQFACDTCYTTSDSPLKHFCEKCKKVWFCSPTCKMKAKLYPTMKQRGQYANKSCLTKFIYHQFECSVMDAPHPAYISKKQAVDLKLLIRVLAKRSAEKSKGSTEEFETAKELVANVDRMVSDMLSNITAIISHLKEIVAARKSKLLEGMTHEDLVQFLGSIQCNNFALKNFGIDKHYFGQGLFLKASLLNHSCAPNVNVKMRNGCIEFLMLESVEAGTELNITYTDPSSPNRHQHLEDNYLFSCACKVCSLEM